MKRPVRKACTTALALALAFAVTPMVFAEESGEISAEDVVLDGSVMTEEVATDETIDDAAADEAVASGEVEAEGAVTEVDAEVEQEEALATEAVADDAILDPASIPLTAADEGEYFAGHEADGFRFEDGQYIAPEERVDAELGTQAEFVMWEKDSDGNYISSNGKVIEGAVRRGVDVSEWQSKPDWKKAKADDISFAIIRCGGTGEVSRKMYEDSEFKYNVEQCEKLGIPYGIYYYSCALNAKDAKAEAKYVIELLKGTNPTLPVYFDLEYNYIDGTTDVDVHAAMAKAFCDTIEAAGYTPGVYASLYWWNHYLTDPIFDTWTRWVAQYYSVCQYEGHYRFWQATSVASVDGISGGVDLNFDFMSDDWQTDASSTVLKRLWGSNAFGTMQAISKQGWSSSANAVVATSEGYWDALAASSLAGKLGCPVLLTNKASLNEKTASELERLGVKKVYLVGGTSAITKDVETSIKALGCTVKRVYGADAPATACAIANELGSSRSTTCFVATSRGYWDALSVSPIAYAKKMPVFLTNATSKELSPSTLAAIKEGGYTKVVIAGGTAAVPASVVTQLKELGITSIARKSGATAYETSTAVAKYGLSLGLSANGFGVATGTGYWDALTGAAFCGKNNSVLLLVNDVNRSAISDFVEPNLSKIKKGFVFGGKAAVTSWTWNALVNALG